MFYIEQELKQIYSLRHARIQTREIKAILLKRIGIVTESINNYRKFASLQPGKVADNCNKIADSIEQRLNSILA